MSATLPDDAGVADLAGDLVRAVLGIGRSTARIFALELRDVSRRLGRRLALAVVSAVFLAVGLLLALGAAALVAHESLHVPLWGAMAAFGALAAAAGALGLRSALRRLGRPDIAFPETVAELAKDADALARRGEPR